MGGDGRVAIPTTGTTDGADGTRDVDVVVRARASIEDDDDGEVDGWEGEGERARVVRRARPGCVARARKGGRGASYPRWRAPRGARDARASRETGGGGVNNESSRENGTIVASERGKEEGETEIWGGQRNASETKTPRRKAQ